MTLSHDVLAWLARASVVLPHHAEVLLLDVVTVAVAARQLWCAEHCPIHGGTLQIQQSLRRQVHGVDGPMPLWITSESDANARRYLCSATGVE